MEKYGSMKLSPLLESCDPYYYVAKHEEQCCDG